MTSTYLDLSNSHNPGTRNSRILLQNFLSTCFCISFMYLFVFRYIEIIALNYRVSCSHDNRVFVWQRYSHKRRAAYFVTLPN